MIRYRLGKLQVKRLLNGETVTDGRGKKIAVTGKCKEILETIDKLDLYHKYDLMIDDAGLHILEKEVEK